MRVRMKLLVLGIYLWVAGLSLNHCNARRSLQLSVATLGQPRRSIILKSTKKYLLRVGKASDTNPQPYGVTSPFSMPPFDSLPPIPPPSCVYPPPSSSTTIPSIIPPPSPTGGNGGSLPLPLPPPYSPSTPTLPGQGLPPCPAGTVPAAPQINVPNPPELVPSPPIFTIPTPTAPLLNPPPVINVPSPSIFVPSPPVFLPPVVYPRPAGPPPRNTAPSTAAWCVAKPSVPDPIIQEAMNYACGSGAECESIQENGSCFEPNTLLAHASYAFNSYWQNSKVGGGTCEFGGTAILVTEDPSYDGCHFVYN